MRSMDCADKAQSGRRTAMTADESVLLCSDRDGVRTLTLNRPRRKNAINRELWIALAQALIDAGKDARRTRGGADRCRGGLLLRC